MTDARHSDLGSESVSTDLVGYVIVRVPDLGSLASVASALAELARERVIRILDLVVLVKDSDGGVSVPEIGAVESLAPLDPVKGEVGGLLSDHDIELASLALPAGTAGIVVVTEDRWAEPLSAAAQRSGGRIIAGDRIPPSRIEAALATRPSDESAGA
jgi:hypothetical protein